MRLEYLSKVRPPVTFRPGVWVCVIAVSCGVLGFGCWGLIDYVDVRYGAMRAQNFYPIWVVPLLLVLFWPTILFRRMEENRRVGLMLAALLGAILLTAVLTLGAGPLFHDAIGGNVVLPRIGGRPRGR